MRLPPSCDTGLKAVFITSMMHDNYVLLSTFLCVLDGMLGFSTVPTVVVTSLQMSVV